VRTLPTTMIQVLAPFAPLFSERVFRHVQLLLAGAMLAPGKRTVASALRAVGLQEERRFCRYHRVLSRALWSRAVRLAACSWSCWWRLSRRMDHSYWA
jgi:DDE superfamily endonuclease